MVCVLFYSIRKGEGAFLLELGLWGSNSSGVRVCSARQISYTLTVV